MTCLAAPQAQPRVNLPYPPPPVHQLPQQPQVTHNTYFDPSPVDRKVCGGRRQNILIMCSVTGILH